MVLRLSCPTAHGIPPDQGSNPCPLHWQADSSAPHYRGTPRTATLHSLSAKNYTRKMAGVCVLASCGCRNIHVMETRSPVSFPTVLAGRVLPGSCRGEPVFLPFLLLKSLMVLPHITVSSCFLTRLIPVLSWFPPYEDIGDDIRPTCRTQLNLPTAGSLI